MSPALAPAVSLLGGGAGNAAIGSLVGGAVTTGEAPAVQRDLAPSVRRTLQNLSADSLRFLFALMYTSSETELVAAMRLIPDDVWVQMTVLAGDALSPAEGSARILWARYRDHRVFATLAQIPAANTASFFTWLSNTSRERLARSLTHAMVTTDEHRRAVKAMFDATPDGELRTLQDLFAARYRVRPVGGGDNPQAFTATAIRRLWAIFASLPEGAVADNPQFGTLERERGGDGSGYYVDSTGAVVISYARLTERLNVVDTTAGRESRGVSMGGGPMAGQNVFDGVVRHEVGHAVDNRLSLRQAYCIGSAKTSGGAWESHGTGSVAATVVAASGGAISALGAPHKAAVVAALQRCINGREPEKIDRRVRHALAGLPAASRQATIAACLADTAVTSLKVSFSGKKPGNPWYRSADDGGVPVNGRIYQESYPGEWWSYAHATRATKVSKYQYRSPYEWIAEAYNAYYTPPTRGQLLQGIDPTTKAWFDTNVHQATAGVEGRREQAPPAADGGPGFS